MYLCLQLCLICPELMITYRKDYSKMRQMLNDMDMKRAMKYRDAVDGFVVLSAFMIPVVNRHNRPWTILDGLCNLTAIDKQGREVGRTLHPVCR